MKYKKNWFFVGVGTIAFVGILLFFAFRFFTPFGAVVNYQFTSVVNRDKVSKIKGALAANSLNPGKTGILQIPQQIIRQNIVTFNLKLITKPIEGVWVNLRFKGNPKRVRIGVRGTEKEKYIYQPLYNQIIEDSDWNKTIDKDFTFLQKTKKYQNISELMQKPPLEDTVASFYFDTSKFVKENKNDSKKNTKIEKELRGTHTFYVKVNYKPFILTVKKQDANDYKGEDSLSVQIHYGQVKIAEQIVQDDGVTDAGRLKMKEQIGEIKIDDPKFGIYKIILKDLTPNADILIKSVEVNQPFLVIENSLQILDQKPSIVWTNVKTIKMKTYHAPYIQTVKLDKKYDLKIDKEAKDFEFDLNKPENTSNTKELHRLDIPKNDLIISGDGYFSFSEDAFINPEPIKTIDLTTLSDTSKIDYILADYQPVKQEGEWKVAKAFFDPKDIKIEGDKLYFSLESPELDSYGGEIIIDNLEVAVKKPGWLNNADSLLSTSEAPVEENKQLNFFEKIVKFFKDLFSPKKAVVSEKKVESAPPLSPSPVKSPTHTPTPSPKPRELLKITVLNGGAGRGSAGIFAGILKQEGFTNVVASNAAGFDTRYARIKYNKNDGETVRGFITQIIGLLKQDYDQVFQDNSENEKRTITITLGENPKKITPSPTATTSGAITPTNKP